MKKTYVIIGLGLIGGSLAAAISRRIPNARVVAFSRHGRKIKFAKKKKFIDEGFTQLKAAVSSADFIFVCTPVDTIPRMVSEIDRYAKVGAIVTDVGSTKSQIVNSIGRKKLKRVKFVGSHPLAGSHLTGVTHAQPNLFERAVVFVTPSQKTSSRAAREISGVWRKLGTRVHQLSPERHDQLVSEISHLPHAVAAALMNAVSASSLPFAASGFLDTTRVAQGDLNLWVPIFLTNKKNLIKNLKTLGDTLTKLARLIRNDREQALAQFLQKASSKRSKLA